MEAPLHSQNKSISNNSKEILLKLIVNASKLGVTDIVIPCVDQSALKGKSDQKRLIVNLSESIELATKLKINLALETDLAPLPFLELLNKFENDAINAAMGKGIKTVAFTGGTGSKMENICECRIVPISSSEKIQEVHIMFVYILCYLIEENIYKN